MAVKPPTQMQEGSAPSPPELVPELAEVAELSALRSLLTGQGGSTANADRGLGCRNFLIRLRLRAPPRRRAPRQGAVSRFAKASAYAPHLQQKATRLPRGTVDVVQLAWELPPLAIRMMLLAHLMHGERLLADRGLALHRRQEAHLQMLPCH